MLNCWNSLDFQILEPAYTPLKTWQLCAAVWSPVSCLLSIQKHLRFPKAVQIASATLVVSSNCFCDLRCLSFWKQELLPIIIICDRASMISNGGATKARGFTISWVATPEDECGIKGKLGLSFAPGKNCTRGVETWSRSMCGNYFSCCMFISRRHS